VDDLIAGSVGNVELKMPGAILTQIEDRDDEFSVSRLDRRRCVRGSEHRVGIFDEARIAFALFGAYEMISVVGDLVAASVFAVKLLDDRREIVLVLPSRREPPGSLLKPRLYPLGPVPSTARSA